MNSFRFVERGIRAEVERQVGLLESGQNVVQETLHFDPQSGTLTPLRSKEEAHDYRYFPEPDLVPVRVTEEMVAAARAELPELPAARAERYLELQLSADTARRFAYRPDLGDYFERALAVAAAGDGADVSAQSLANWVAELASQLDDADPAESKVAPEALARLAGLVTGRGVTSAVAQQVLGRLVAEGGDPAAIVESEGLATIGGGGELEETVRAAIEANPDAAERVRAGKAEAIGPIVGYVMRETKGRADGGQVTRMVRERLGV
jgi:aspartyl-tRNA(Asn)/glutamyl-tRNA(Gln) amidotransferase subunit B